MKKTYIIPETEIEIMELEQMIAASEELSVIGEVSEPLDRDDDFFD